MNFLSQYMRPQQYGMGQAEAGYGMGHPRDGSRFPLDFQTYMQQAGQMQPSPSFGQGNHGKGLAGIMQQGPDNTIMPVPMPQTGGQMPPMQQMPGNGGALPPQQVQPQGLRGLMDWARLMGGRSY